jgi:hypothetical protein
VKEKARERCRAEGPGLPAGGLENIQELFQRHACTDLPQRKKAAGI